MQRHVALNGRRKMNKKATAAIAPGRLPAVQIGIYTECAGTGQACVVCGKPIEVKQGCACADVRDREYPMHSECMRAWQDTVRASQRDGADVAASRSRKPNQG